MTESTIGIDRDQMQTFLRVLPRPSTRLPPEHPDAVAVRGRRPRIFKTVKLARRAERRAAVRAADAAVTAATATGAPGRIDDETAGHAAASRDATGAIAGTLRRGRAPATSASSATPRSTRSTTSSARTARRSTAPRRDARTDLTGRRALLTGGRAKIGMYIALRLLRDGAHTTITTRFPNDAVRRFARDAGQRRLAAPAADRRHRPARPGPGGRARRLGRRARARSTS